MRIGAGDQIGAIEEALRLFAEARFPLPPELVPRVQRWLDAYAGSPEEPRLRRLLLSAADGEIPFPRTEVIDTRSADTQVAEEPVCQ